QRNHGPAPDDRVCARAGRRDAAGLPGDREDIAMKTLLVVLLFVVVAPARSRATDPTGPRHIVAPPTEPALTFDLPGAAYPLGTQYSTTLMRFERRTPAGDYVDAPWLVNGFRAEQGITFDYNTFNRYPQRPEVSTLPIGEACGSNTADAGNFGLGGMDIDW